MAIAVIVGILFATFLTLVLVPVMYSLTDDMGRSSAVTSPRRESRRRPRKAASRFRALDWHFG